MLVSVLPPFLCFSFDRGKMESARDLGVVTDEAEVEYCRLSHNHHLGT